MIVEISSNVSSVTSAVGTVKILDAGVDRRCQEQHEQGQQNTWSLRICTTPLLGITPIILASQANTCQTRWEHGFEKALGPQFKRLITITKSFPPKRTTSHPNNGDILVSQPL